MRTSRDADAVTRAATVAVNRAEAMGGASVVFHLESMTDEAQTALELEGALRDAVARRTWSVAYQPIVEARSGSIAGVEALLRFPGHESPAAHIALAEENGLIVPLGLQILEQACRDARSWATLHPLDTVHVNVSARQLVEPDFVASVRRVFGEHPPASHVMTIEVTETVMSAEPERASQALSELRELGASIALDDFGTGYSSLATLHTFPIDVIKLDRAFTLDVATSQRMRSVVRSSIELAHALEMSVVAEGVEDAAQLEVLRELGCDTIQGFLIARPLHFDELVVWLRAHAADQQAKVLAESP
jgi:EAL domain-containing protein (putative c-di-GMP-specific phosphodiesterase class I)